MLDPVKPCGHNSSMVIGWKYVTCNRPLHKICTGYAQDMRKICTLYILHLRTDMEECTISTQDHWTVKGGG